MHVELHFCPTARDAARLQHAGLPRFDLEPSKCGACNARVGEVNGEDGAVFWKPLTVVVWEDGVDVLCERCVRPVDKVTGKR